MGRRMAVAFGILGPLEATRDGDPVELGAAKQRALLAILLILATLLGVLGVAAVRARPRPPGGRPGAGRDSRSGQGL